MAPFDDIDFRDKHEEAKKWGEKVLIKQNELLDAKDKKASETFAENSIKINTYLKDCKGELLDDAKIAEIEEYPDNINEMVKEFDHAIDKIELPQTFTGYLRCSETSFPGVGVLPGEFRTLDGKVNEKFVEHVVENYSNKKFLVYDYLKVGMTNKVETGKNHLPFLFKLRIPVGTKVLYVHDKLSPHKEQFHLIVKHGYEINIQDIRLTTEFTAKRMLVTASLSAKKH